MTHHEEPLEHAEEMAQALLREEYDAQLQGAAPGERAAIAKELATRVLARLDTPGDSDLHEAVFAMAYRMAGAEAQNRFDT